MRWEESGIEKAEHADLQMLVLRGDLLVRSMVVVALLLLDTNGANSLDVGDKPAAVSGRIGGGGVLVEDVDGFERETLGLGDAKVGEDEAADTGGTPEEEDLDSEVGVSGTIVDEVGS